jgi:glycosyltransferase involved in cell wall biosynthesis
MPSKKKVCFVSLYAYPLFNPDCQGQFGGSEVRTSIIIKGLARSAQYDLSLIVFDHGQPELEKIDGVSLYSWKGRHGPIALKELPETTTNDEPEQGHSIDYHNHLKATSGKVISILSEDEEYFPDSIIGRLKARIRRKFKNRISAEVWSLIKFIYTISKTPFRLLLLIPDLHQRIKWRIDHIRKWFDRLYNRTFHQFGSIGEHTILRKNISIYDRVDADIYILHGNSELNADLIYFCKKRGKKFIFLAGSDMDYDPDYKISPRKLNRYSVPHYLMAYAIEEADIHCVQNERQAQILAEHYQRESTIIKNPINLDHRLQPVSSKGDVLWVGKSDSIKRPEIILELATRLPMLKFTLIMTFSNKDIHLQSVKKSKALPNVNICPFVPYNEIESYFAAHRILVNTSILEGFPNTFLQAAKYGLPIVTSRVDPGFMLTKHHCGICSEDDFEKLAASTLALCTDQDLYQKTSENCLNYIKSNHSEEIIISKYRSLIDSMFTA